MNITTLNHTDNNPVPVKVTNPSTPPPFEGGNRQVIIPTAEKLYPYPPRINFEKLDIGNRNPAWLSEDGEITYFLYGRRVTQSKDDGDTHEVIGPDFERAVNAIRILGDGELLVSTGRDTQAGIKAKLWKTENYDRDNPSATTFKQVHKAIGDTASFYNDWGIDTYGEIVVACEYGLQGGANNVFLSKDFGETFTKIYNQEEEFNRLGLDFDISTAHTHTAAYDPWFNRIWIITGDGRNCSTWYSDDFGQHWHLVEGSLGMEAVQYTGIMPMPDGVVFGSDRPQNGLHIFKRDGKDRSSKVVIEPWFLVDGYDITSQVFQMAFRRDYTKNREVYFSSVWDPRAGSGKGHAVIMSFVNTESVNLVYESTTQFDTSNGFRHVIGPTAKGNVLTTLVEDNNRYLFRGNAPSWE